MGKGHLFFFPLYPQQLAQYIFNRCIWLWNSLKWAEIAYKHLETMNLIWGLVLYVMNRDDSWKQRDPQRNIEEEQTAKDRALGIPTVKRWEKEKGSHESESETGKLGNYAKGDKEFLISVKPSKGFWPLWPLVKVKGQGGEEIAITPVQRVCFRHCLTKDHNYHNHQVT